MTFSCSESKAQKLFSAVTQARLKGEENLKARKWYSTTLGIKQNLQDIFPTLVNITTEEFYGKSELLFRILLTCAAIEMFIDLKHPIRCDSLTI